MKKSNLKLEKPHFETAKPEPYYECSTRGVYYHAVSVENDGTITEKAPKRLSDMIRLIGYGVDEAGEHYRVIEWRDRFDNQLNISALAMADIGSCWSFLQGKGIAVQSSRQKRDLLADYLMTEGDKTPYIITNKAGWCDNYRAYVLPSGEIINTSKTNIIYNGDSSQASYYESKGTLKEWQDNIARYAVGNSRFCLALGSAFASPLMRLLDIEGGGFHLFSDSSDGKTTAANVALSVWGEAGMLKTQWNGTAHAFENIASARNDNLVALDELKEASPKVVSQAAYSLLNGVGKIQGRKEGGNRCVKRWRVLLFSTGEETLESLVKSGGLSFHAGQSVRLPSIPANADKGYGAFETIHDMPSSAELSEHLNYASSRYCGVAGKAFIEQVINDKDNAIATVEAAMRAFMESLPELTGQSRRVAKRFALVAGALELATQYGITGHPAGGSAMAIKQCFDDWLMREGVGKFEDRKIIEQVEAFMQQTANSYRFTLWDSDDKGAVPNLAGYRRYLGIELNEGNQQEYWIIPAVFKDEICKGFEVKKVASLLAGIDWLSKPKTGYQKQRKNRGRFYVLVGEANPQYGREEGEE